MCEKKGKIPQVRLCHAMVGFHLSSLLVTEVQRALAQMSRVPEGLHRKPGAAEGHQEEPAVLGSHL